MSSSSSSNWSNDGPPGTVPYCLECGAAQPDGKTCEGHFHQMLAWEWEDPRISIVHHLMVLSYHLQHPSLYSREGLEAGKQLLVDFVERGVTAGEARHRNRGRVDSGRREFKITARPDSRGSYDHPVQWTMTAPDVISAGMEHYVDSVQGWARSILDALRASGNLA